MKTKRHLALLGASMLALAFVNCGEPEEEQQTTKKDGGAPPPADAGTEEPGGSTDAGTRDAGFIPSPEVTIPEFTNPADRKYVGKRVKFRGVATTGRIRTRKTNDFCEYSVFMADARVDQAEHNGVIVTSRSTVNDEGNCAGDSQFSSDIKVGDEFEIDGLYQENCMFFKDGACQDKDQDGNDITLPMVRANFPNNVKKLGSNVALPAALPKTVSIDQINSGWVNAAESCSPYVLGSDWWKYRAVLVKVENVAVTVENPDATAECVGANTGNFGDYRVAPKGDTEPSIRVGNNAFPFEEGNDHRPAVDDEFDYIQGVLYFNFGNSKILPRQPADGSPALP